MAIEMEASSGQRPWPETVMGRSQTDNEIAENKLYLGVVDNWVTRKYGQLIVEELIAPREGL